jgi:hypothetical protein
MAGISLNIVDLVKGYLSGGTTDSISSLLGESKEKTQSGINAAVPGLLSGFTTVASTPDGAQRLSSAVDNGDEGILSNLSSILGKGSSSEAGSGILQSVLGAGGLSQLTGLIGKSSGLSGNSTGRLLSFLAPVVIGVLKKLTTSSGLDSAGLSNLLSSQRSNIAAAMPEGMRKEIQEPAAEPRFAPRDIRPAAATYSTPEVHRRSHLSGVLPLIALVLLALLIWRWTTRLSTHAGNEGRGTTTEQTYGAKPGMGVSLDMLKDKYQSVIGVAQSQGVQISNMTSENGKFVITGTAPSVEAANNVWNEIKRVNPRMDDITANFTVR